MEEWMLQVRPPFRTRFSIIPLGEPGYLEVHRSGMHGLTADGLIRQSGWMTGSWMVILHFRHSCSGPGFDLETLESRVQLDVEGSRFRDQAFNAFNLTGRVNRNRISGDASLTLDESMASANSVIQNWQDTPDYEFDIMLSALDLSEITFGGAELLPSRLNGTLTGTGRLFDPEQMTVNAEMRFDSSYVNGEEIETLQGRFAIQNSRLIVENAELESSIVDASIQLNQHLFEFTNPSNTLDFRAELKNLDPVAEQFGLRELRSGGTVSGSITRNDSGVLQFDAEAELTEIAVDSLLRASEMTGTATAYLKENTEAELQLDISEPVINEFPLQDIFIRVSPVISAGRTTGQMEFEIMGNETIPSHSRVNSVWIPLLLGSAQINLILQPRNGYSH